MKKRTSSKTSATKTRKGMVFGVFDCLHKGHQYLLNEASEKCGNLIVVVTPDSVVKTMKGRSPQKTSPERMSAIKTYNSNFQVVAGDEHIGSWQVFERYPCDVVYLGHDQQNIGKVLEAIGVRHVYLKPYKPEKYKTSILIKKSAL